MRHGVSRRSLPTQRATRAIVVVESPLSRRDAARFGLAEFVGRGVDVLVWDVSRMFLPRSREQWIDPADNLTVVPISNAMELSQAASALRSSDVVITYVGTGNGQLRSHRGLLQSLSRSPARVFTVSAGRVLAPDLGATGESAPQRIGGRAGRIPCRPMLRKWVVRGRVRRRALQAWVHFRWGIGPLDGVLLGTTALTVNPLLIGPRTGLTWIHSFDYDLVLREPPIPEDEQSRTILIDSMGPLHPDYRTFDLNPWTVASEDYFAIVRGRLDQIEFAMSSRVEVAAHPRAQPGSLDGFYGGRTVHYGKTAWAIRRARLVVFTNTSTAVGMAVAMGRPAVMIDGDFLPPAIRRANMHLVSSLGLNVLTADGRVPEWDDVRVDDERYAWYLAEYVKHPGTPEVPFWTVAVDALGIVRPDDATV